MKLAPKNTPFRLSLAHSAPVYVTLRGAPPLSQQPSAKTMARIWLARLADFKARLAEDKVQYLLSGSGPETTEAVIRRDRTALLREIEVARAKYLNLAGR